MEWRQGQLLALYEIQKSADYRVVALMTTMTQDYDRISMHGVRRVLLESRTSRYIVINSSLGTTCVESILCG